ncbi:unnamed protein product [Microthlaspi erraticum]|uniref:Uncharacterized protein n=1 Tax=Microthlaspi erraticum TaxID=1685480 RepID=A0A6D2JK55_9BRAS|nr:unnamed protein product [Microthlaspi erraticum]
MFRARPNISVRLKSRPKFKPPADHNTTRETLSRGRPSTTSRHAAHDQPREPGTSLAAAQPFAYHGRCIRPSREERPTSGRETIGQISSVRPQPADREIIRPRPFRLGQDPTVRPIVPTDRPNAAVDPKPFLKPNPHNSSPKPAPT